MRLMLVSLVAAGLITSTVTAPANAAPTLPGGVGAGAGARGAADATGRERAQQVRCEFIGARNRSTCMLPFPNDYFTRSSPSTRTGRVVRFERGALPVNSAGRQMSPAPFRFNDGFSPGSPIVVRVPGLDEPEALARTGPVGLSAPAEYRARRAPVVVVEAETGQRWPIWVELDSNAETRATTAVLIHPARNFTPGNRYIVAMRRLRDASGSVLRAPRGFRTYRDRLPSRDTGVERRRSHFESIFRTLRTSGIGRQKLYLAWDFTVASQQNIAGRLLHMRNRTLARLGDRRTADSRIQGRPPRFVIDAVTPDPRLGIARRVQGRLDVPCYLAPGCGENVDGVFDLDTRGLPRRTGTTQARFACIVPDRALITPARPTLFGHGLFGSAGAVTHEPQAQFARDHNFVMCATDFLGLSVSDLGRAETALSDFGRFPIIGDRLQQGLLNQVALGRLMAHQEGLLSHPAFRADETLASAGVFTPDRVFYRGTSLGGILGGAFTAIAPDTRRSHLIVNGMNFSVLLQRSVLWKVYGPVADRGYPNRLDQALGLSIIQMLWDRGEANGYATRMTDNPLPGTPTHEVLMDIAFGDQTVTNFQANVLARTAAIPIRRPALIAGRWPGVDLTWDMTSIRRFPHRGSALFTWDAGPQGWAKGRGNAPPPLTNTAPVDAGANPHGFLNRDIASQRNASSFLRDPRQSTVVDVCDGRPCFLNGYPGP